MDRDDEHERHDGPRFRKVLRPPFSRAKTVPASVNRELADEPRDAQGD